MVAPTDQSAPITDDFDVPDLPPLTPSGKRFIAAYISSGFNLQAACMAAELPPEKAHLYTTDPRLQAHLESHFRFTHLAVKCVAAAARQAVIAELTKLLAACDDPQEREKLLLRLQRATAASLVPCGHSRGGPNARPPTQDQRSRTPDPSSEDPQAQTEDPNSDLPRTLVTFKPTQSPKETAFDLFYALHRKDNPDLDSDLAAVADAIEFDAQIDGHPVEGDDPLETIEAIAETSLVRLRAFRKARHDQSIAHSSSAATEVWNVLTASGTTKVTMDFTKAPPDDSLSRAPGRWLLRKLTTAPGPPWEEVEARERAAKTQANPPPTDSG